MHANLPALEAAPLGEAEHHLAALESLLVEMRVALQRPDPAAVDAVTVRLQVALALAIDAFRHSGGVPAALRRRLALAGSEVAAQREAIARASVSLERAMDVLLPHATAPAPLYSASGASRRPPLSGSVHA